MKLSISNIAWDISEDDKIANLLRRHNVNAIDIAPGKYFPELANVKNKEIAQVRNWWGERGIEIIGMQALLYGSIGLNLFGAKEIQDAMIARLEVVCKIGNGLNAKRLVFGSPKNRDRSGLNDQIATDIATDFFKRLGHIAKSYGVTVCLEPNPPCYGANFMTTSYETANIVKHIDHPAIKMQLDTGALIINNEDITSLLDLHSSQIGHIHLSEPNLVPLGDCDTDHKSISMVFEQYLPDYFATIEMVATNNEPHESSIERAIIAASQNYMVRSEISI